jgi:PhnB protein
MAEQELSEQLNQFVDAIIANPDGPLPRADSHSAPLVSIAAELRGLPREEFRTRLKDDLERTAATMMTSAAESRKPFREGFHTITPYLAVKEANELIDFVKQAFGAEGTIHGTGSEGGIHAEYKIGDSIVTIGGGGAWSGTPKLTALHLYVDDVDAVYRRSLDAGATSMQEPIEDHGERVAGVKDLAGNEWYIARRLSGTHTAEGLRTVTVYLHPRGTGEMIEFLKPAFGAEEVVVYREQPEGPVVHAKIRIGDSVLEMGEAHGQYQPMSSMFYLYVDDVDAWHRRAVSAGGVSIAEPTDQPYGDRVGAVTDSFGNTWYMATPVSDK